MNGVTQRILLVVVGSALIAVGSLAGCGGEEEQPTTTTSTAVTTTSSTTTTLADGETTTTVTSEADETTTTTVATSVLLDGLPVAYLDSLGRRPIVVLFYVPGEVDDEEVVDSVRELRSTYPTYTFLIYDYKLPDAYGDLADLLMVNYQPHISLIDRNGFVQRVWSGFVDKGTLNQTLIDLGRY